MAVARNQHLNHLNWHFPAPSRYGRALGLVAFGLCLKTLNDKRSSGKALSDNNEAAPVMFKPVQFVASNRHFFCAPVSPEHLL
jgi:hypothetical protein